MRKRILIALALSLGLTGTTAGHVTAPILPLQPSAFTPVIIPFEIERIEENLGSKLVAPTERPTVRVNQAEPKGEAKSQPVIVSKSKNKGIASWYCNADDPNGDTSRCYKGVPDGAGKDYYAAVRRDLLFLRGKTVKVCAAGKCINVKVIDCNCGKHANIIDLYADAFDALYGDIGLGRRPIRLYY